MITFTPVKNALNMLITLREESLRPVQVEVIEK
jgi:hypothetical protein